MRLTHIVLAAFLLAGSIAVVELARSIPQAAEAVATFLADAN